MLLLNYLNPPDKIKNQENRKNLILDLHYLNYLPANIIMYSIIYINMNKNKCAPGKYDSKNDTCFGIDEIIQIAGAYNRYLTKSLLTPNNINPSQSKPNFITIKPDKQYLLQQMRNIFSSECGNDDHCLTRREFMREISMEVAKNINDSFRTEGPQNNTEWLNTSHIESLMRQYENVLPHFKFMGAVPLNCGDLSFCSLYNINFDKYSSQGIKEIGIVFNLDKYGQPGSHWVSLYININKGEIYFCDSNGKPPKQNITNIIDAFKQYYKQKKGKNIVYKYNTNAYQKDNSECGVYSCNFIIRNLAGESFNDIVNNPLKFSEINSCRNKYFINPSSKYSIHSKCEPELPYKKN